MYDSSALFVFTAGDSGEWSIDAVHPVCGATLPAAPRLAVTNGSPGRSAGANWELFGFTSNMRYTERDEHSAMAARPAALGRPAATRAALIPISKSAAWWAMAQNERRAVFEAQSHHIAIGLDYMPAVARRLHHCRDIGGAFDFLTWFEFAPEDTAAFDAMLVRLRATPEWGYVDHEVDIRLSRVAAA